MKLSGANAVFISRVGVDGDAERSHEKLRYEKPTEFTRKPSYPTILPYSY